MVTDAMRIFFYGGIFLRAEKQKRISFFFNKNKCFSVGITFIFFIQKIIIVGLTLAASLIGEDLKPV